VDRLTSSRERIGWLVAAAGVVAVVLLMTLWPDATVNTANFVPFREHSEALGCLLTGCDTAREAARFLAVDVAGNLVVFIPVGIVFAGVQAGVTSRRRFRVAVGLGAALSGMIEAIQSTIPTRATDVDDLLFNTIGTALGAALLIWYRRSR
jgi:glycopeptide antibiotics resistance protein